VKVAVTGGTGLIGAALVARLRERGDDVTVLTRDPGRTLPEGVAAAAWPDPVAAPPPAEALNGADAVVHLLGEPIAQRWNQRAKNEIRDSRVLSTRALSKALRDLPEAERPKVLVSQSATGFYGPRDAEPVDESSPPGRDWLSELVVAWEREAMAAADLMRVVVTRTGVVLAPDGGALEKMLPFFKLGIGGPVAGGKQYMPWIHLDDVVGGLLHCLGRSAAEGPINLTAPQAATNAEFSKALGTALHRPAVLPVPAFAIRALYGEMAMIVTTGQNVRPSRLEMLEYTFRQPELLPALQAVVGKPRP
jgi:uncharacterized protein (TIGR01777 family)